MSDIINYKGFIFKINKNGSINKVGLKGSRLEAYNELIANPDIALKNKTVKQDEVDNDEIIIEKKSDQKYRKLKKEVGSMKSMMEEVLRQSRERSNNKIEEPKQEPKQEVKEEVKQPEPPKPNPEDEEKNKLKKLFGF